MNEMNAINSWKADELEDILEERNRHYVCHAGSSLDIFKPLLRFMVCFHKFDIYQCEEFHDCSCHSLFTCRGGSRAKRCFKNSLPKWTRYVQTIFYWILARLIIGTIVQYIYDNHKFERRRIMSNLSTPVSNTTFDKEQETGVSNATSTLSILNDTIREDRRLLKIIGAPYLEYDFIVECGYIIMMVLGLSLYWQADLFHKIFYPANLYLLRLLLDEKRERKNLNKMTLNEAGKFISSSYNFARIQVKILDKLSQRHLLLNNVGAINRFRRLSNGIDEKSAAGRIMKKHRRVIDMIEQLFSEGRLEPINRDPKNVHKTLLYFAISSSFLFATFTIYGTLYLIILPITLANNKPNFENFMDYLTCLEFAALAYSICIWAAHGVTLITIYSIDTSSIISKLKIKMIDLMNASAKNYYALKDSPCTLSKSNQMDNHQLDSELVATYLQFKFFMRQMQIMTPLFSFYLTSAIQVMLMVPVLLFIHYPYIQEGGQLLLVPAVVYLVCGDLCTLPMCHMHSRCVKMYELLFSLYAHLIKLKEIERAKFIDIGDSRLATRLLDSDNDIFPYGHTIHMLQKELKSPDILKSQFEIRLYGTPNTYPNMLKIHFYLGILVLFSLLMGSKVDVNSLDGSFLSSSLSII